MSHQKILRLHFTQPTAHYRIGFTQQNLHRTYPLPPPSTVLGMIHNLMGCKTGEQIRDIDIAVVGKYESVYYQYQLFRNLGNPKKHAYKEAHPGGSMPTKVQLLNSMDIYIYIKSNKEGKYLLDGKKKDFEEIVQAFDNPIMPFIIGRREDIAILEEYKIIDSLEYNELPPGGFQKYATWIRKDSNKEYNFKGISHLLNTYYELKGNIRNFEKQRYIFIEPQDIELLFKDGDIQVPKLYLDKITIEIENENKEVSVPIEFLLDGGGGN